MTPAERFTPLLAPYRPQVPLPHLVAELNLLYHRFEAHDYDHQHPELHRQLPPLWQEMIHTLPATSWNILDFGCGTGFEAGQLRRHLPNAHLTCYDPSPEMLAGCRANIGDSARFTSAQAGLAAGAPYNLLATNSLLHHLPDPVATLASLSRLLAPGAFWLCGHEPSSRFYGNRHCLEIFHSFRRAKKRRKLLQIAAYRQKAGHLLGLTPAHKAAREALRRRLFAKKPSASVVSSLVDFYAPHPRGDAGPAQGFDIVTLRRQLAESWQLIWCRSYAFLGPVYYERVSARWRRAQERLRALYPYDGANFCAVWRRR